MGRLQDGRRVYFDACAAPYGSMAERALVPEDALYDIAEGVDDATAAALGNTGLGAWLAVALALGAAARRDRARARRDRRVRRVAVQAAKLLGAGRVVAAARASERLSGCSTAARTRSSSSTPTTTSRRRCATPPAARCT